MKNEKINESILYIDESSVYDDITDEARSIIESSRLLSGDDEDLFYAHIKYFTDSPVILREINRILSMNKTMNKYKKR